MPWFFLVGDTGNLGRRLLRPLPLPVTPAEGCTTSDTTGISGVTTDALATLLMDSLKMGERGGVRKWRMI